MPFASGVQANTYFTQASFTQQSYGIKVNPTIGGVDTRFIIDPSASISFGIKTNLSNYKPRNPKILDFRA